MTTIIESIKKDWRVKVLIILFVLLTVWWRLSPEIVGIDYYHFRFQFAGDYFIVALFGAVCGFVSLRHVRSMLLRRAMLFFSLGLLCEVFGQLVYESYTLFLHVDVPYPSIGDIGYFLCIPMYLVGVIYLSRLAGAKAWLESYENVFQAVVISVVTLVLAYGLFLSGYVFDLSNPLKVFLDFAYPFGQAVYLCIGILAYLAVQSDQKNIYKTVVFLALSALFLQFLSDYMFVFEASRGTWVLGGNNDYLYLVSYFVMGLTVLVLDSVG